MKSSRTLPCSFRRKNQVQLSATKNYHPSTMCLQGPAASFTRNIEGLDTFEKRTLPATAGQSSTFSLLVVTAFISLQRTLKKDISEGCGGIIHPDTVSFSGSTSRQPVETDTAVVFGASDCPPYPVLNPPLLPFPHLYSAPCDRYTWYHIPYILGESTDRGLIHTYCIHIGRFLLLIFQLVNLMTEERTGLKFFVSFSVWCGCSQLRRLYDTLWVLSAAVIHLSCIACVRVFVRPPSFSVVLPVPFAEPNGDVFGVQPRHRSGGPQLLRQVLYGDFSRVNVPWWSCLVLYL